MSKIMTYLNKHKYFIASFIINIILYICLMSNCRGSEPTTKVEYIPVHDTVTVTQERIVEKTKVKYIDRIDTFYVYNGDTIYVQDLPIEHKEYKDTISTDSTSTEINIKYSGFNANIEEVGLKHNYYEKKETVVLPPKKVTVVWFVGFSAGYGGHGNVNNGTFGHGPEAGIHAGIGIGGPIKRR